MLLEAFLFLEQTKTKKHLVNRTHLIYDSNGTNIDLCNTQVAKKITFAACLNPKVTLTSTKTFLTCRIDNQIINHYLVIKYTIR